MIAVKSWKRCHNCSDCCNCKYSKKRLLLLNSVQVEFHTVVCEVLKRDSHLIPITTTIMRFLFKKIKYHQTERVPMESIYEVWTLDCHRVSSTLQVEYFLRIRIPKKRKCLFLFGRMKATIKGLWRNSTHARKTQRNMITSENLTSVNPIFQSFFGIINQS